MELELTALSWTTYGLSTIVLCFVAWKIWDTTADPEKRSGEERLLLGRCLYEWRHFLTEFSRAAFMLISLAVAVNFAAAASSPKEIIKYVEKEVKVYSPPEKIIEEVEIHSIKPFPDKEPWGITKALDDFGKKLTPPPFRTISDRIRLNPLFAKHYEPNSPPSLKERKAMDLYFNRIIHELFGNPAAFVPEDNGTARFRCDGIPNSANFRFRIEPGKHGQSHLLRGIVLYNGTSFDGTPYKP